MASVKIRQHRGKLDYHAAMRQPRNDSEKIKSFSRSSLR